MAFYGILIKASQIVYVEADSEEEAMEVGLDNYSPSNFEMDDAYCEDVLENDPGKSYGKVIYK